jgi:hypothetical protein
MIVDPSTSVAISNLGWVDRGALWVYSSSSRTARAVRLSDSSYLRVYCGVGDRFAVSHDGDGDSIEISVHAFSDPERRLAGVRLNGGVFEAYGEVAELGAVPIHYVSYLGEDAADAAGYYLLELGDSPHVRRLDWFDKYDDVYESVLSVNTFDGVGHVFTVQRSSDLVVRDPNTLAVTRTVRMPTGRHGNPTLQLAGSDVRVLVADDYDAVLTLDPKDLTVAKVWEGQAPVGGSRMFIGSLGPALASDSVLVPRPGQGNVVELRVLDLEVVRTWETGAQPLVAAQFADHLVARDWKTGNLLRAATV